jgi:hypothetical protein
MFRSGPPNFLACATPYPVSDPLTPTEAIEKEIKKEKKELDDLRTRKSASWRL